MRVLYIRVSAEDQNIARQEKGGFDKVYIDKVSGAILFKDRPASSKIIKAINKGEISEVHVQDIDRLGRDFEDLLNTLKWFNKKGVVLVIDTIGRSLIDGKPNPNFKFLIGILGSVAEMEREKIRDRQAQGIAIAKAQGKYIGRREGTKIPRDKILNKYESEIKTIKKFPDMSLLNLGKLTALDARTVKKLKRLIQ